METKRLSATERESLVRLNIAFEILTREPELLAARSALIPGAKRDLAMMSTKISKLMAKFLLTIPPDQYRTYINSLKMASYSVGVRRPGGTVRDDKNYGLWLSHEVISGLLDGCYEHCMMCSMDKAERRSCILRKTLDAIPNDAPQRDDGDCPYYTII